MKNRDITYNYLCKLFDRATIEQKNAIIIIKGMMIKEKSENSKNR
jgi:hypothetical protein